VLSLCKDDPTEAWAPTASIQIQTARNADINRIETDVRRFTVAGVCSLYFANNLHDTDNAVSERVLA